jgi:predicted nuclease with RNAse H fold/dephospho-CoA kinase
MTATSKSLNLPKVSPGAARLRADRQLLAAVGVDKSVLFLDIETTGLSRYYDEITLVGYMIHGRYSVYINGDDPSPLLAALEEADSIVTFNGTLFDIPFLLQTFEEASVPTSHIDLRYATRRLGLVGGQKSLEQQLGIQLRADVEDIDGAEAVVLWHRYLRGDIEALRLLVRYNFADVAAMCEILDHVVEQVEHRDLLIETKRFGISNVHLLGHAAPDAVLPDPQRLQKTSPTFQDLFGSTRAATAVCIGIDLTGSEGKPSGFCVLRGAFATTSLIGSDEALIADIIAERPDIVSIDSPLCLPKGRLHVGDDDPGRDQYGIMRVCERTLKRRGINVYPALLPSMQKLTERGIRLADRIRKLGIPVIESYPGAAQDIMGIPRKGAGIYWLQQGLADFGIVGPFRESIPSHDELDAITSALVGTFLLAGKFEPLGGEGESALIIPHLEAPPLPRVIGLSGRIGAGKTTASRWIEELGFAYTRFSLVIDDEIKSMGLPFDRPTRQRVGLEIHNQRGQTWLCDRALLRVVDAPAIVVDGLRWPEDHSYFVERFGDRFFHIHISSPPDLRFDRVGAGVDTRESFDEADASPVEGMIDILGGLAATTIENVSSLEHFKNEIVRILETADSEAQL